ncbi:response regulator [Jiella endophytica]|nr:response regulator [Jiella endophytica]
MMAMNHPTNGGLYTRAIPAIALNARDAFKDEVDTAPPKVMVVDDDPGIVRAISTRCRRLGLDVVTAEGGLQAILRSRNNFPDVLIVDISMPEVDGFKVCEKLLNSRMPAMNVIVLTGRSDNETSERCEAIGAYLVPKNSDAWSNIHAILADLLSLESPPTSLDPASARMPGSNAATLPAAGPRILLVDDDLHMITAMRSRLQKLKATVFVADNGIDGYRTAIREEPHAVITDYLMPNGGGHYLIWRLRERVETASLPIFVVSGEIETEQRPLPRWKDLVGPRAATGVFRKPFHFDEIADALKTHCPIMRE